MMNYLSGKLSIIQIYLILIQKYNQLFRGEAVFEEIKRFNSCDEAKKCLRNNSNRRIDNLQI